MASLNRVFLIGNLTRDPELRYVPSGAAVATFTIAVNRVYKNQAGEKKEQVSFIRVVVWGRIAEVCGEYLSKGSPAFVEGRLQSREWETPEGQKRSAMEVVADRVQFLRAGEKRPGTAAKQGLPPEEIETINLNDCADAQGAKSDDKISSANNPGEEAPF
ncbi:MAG: single-stranded DNA-binding protein [Candidatus Omnitrophota bacterium]|nr:single-stranded DNA-binding protein [Candidatus Omnitrophota bacterium]